MTVSKSTDATTAAVTAALVPDAGASLRQLRERTGLSKTDLVNRAITLYQFVEENLQEGREILVRDGTTGETQTVKLL